MSTWHLDDERAQRHADGLLSGPEWSEAQSHLQECAECRLTVEGYRALAVALSDLAAPQPPSDFTEGVLALIDARERAAARERRLAAMILGFACLALAGLALAAGPVAWAPVLSRLGDAVSSAATWLQLGASVLGPVFRTLRLEIAVAAAGASLTLLAALRHLTARRAELPA
jgi:predicted anti-sigma-YlaC factor YlaD